MVAAPLTELTKKNVPFVWGPLQDTAFESLKCALTSAPVLTVFDATRTTRVACDASSTCVGGVLEQKCDDGQFHPIEFFSKRLNAAQVNYSATEREMLGVILCLERWR